MFFCMVRLDSGDSRPSQLAGLEDEDEITGWRKSKEEEITYKDGVHDSLSLITRIPDVVTGDPRQLSSEGEHQVE